MRVLAVAIIALILPGVVQARRIALGVSPSRTHAAFEDLTHHRHALQAGFLHWGEPFDQERFDNSRAHDFRLMLHIEPAHKQTTRWIARGRGDRWLVKMSRGWNNDAQRVFIRPMAEMNGSFNRYCAYNWNKTPRPGYSTKAYRQAFRRIAIIARAGSRRHMNRQLRRLGMHDIRVHLRRGGIPVSGHVKLVWNPQGESHPMIYANRPAAYFPGYRYVDIVASDTFGWSRWGDAPHPRWSTPYFKFPRRPFMVAEWGSNFDAIGFMRTIFRFAETHGRVRYLVWFDGLRDGPFDLSHKPKMLTAYRRHVHKDVYR